ncbi:MAG: InlB B-repeat-containing protein [Treponema sp.]
MFLTRPLPVLDTSITYNKVNDEYVIHTPKNDGIHTDLKELEIELSTEKDSEIYRQRFSIANSSEQDKDLHLRIKDLISKASGKRTLKVKVKDKAGLVSSQTIKDSGNKIFTSVTPIPSSIKLSKKQSINEGFAKPKIKELYEFFQKPEDWESLNYKVEYNSSGTPFEYDNEKQLFFNTQGTNSGVFTIIITLKQPFATDIVSNFTVTITAQNDTSLEIENGSLIKDITDYSLFERTKELKPLADITSLEFTPSSDLLLAYCDVDYTGFITNLNISLKTNNNEAKIGKENESNLTNTYKETIQLQKEAGMTKKVSFVVTAENGTIQKYKIIFRRKASAKVKIKLEFSPATVTTENAKVKAEWEYSKVEINKNEFEFTIAQGKNINFNINVPDDWEIEKVFSDFPAHGLSNGKNSSYNLLVSGNFVLTVIIKPQIIVSWTRENENGQFSSVHINGKLSNTPATAKKGSNAIFKVEPNEGYQVRKWKINGIEITDSTPNTVLSDDERTLTINNLQDNVVAISVMFAEDKYEVKWEIPSSTEGIIEASIGGEPKTSGLEYVKRGTEIHFEVNTFGGYKFKNWQCNVKDEEEDKNDNSFTAHVKKDIELKAIFVQVFKISVELDSNVPDEAEIYLSIKAPNETSPTAYIVKKGTAINNIEFEKGSDIMLKAHEGYEVTKWLNNDIEITSLPFKSAYIVYSDVNLTNVAQNYKLKVEMKRKE